MVAKKHLLPCAAFKALGHERKVGPVTTKDLIEHVSLLSRPTLFRELGQRQVGVRVDEGFTIILFKFALRSWAACLQTAKQQSWLQPVASIQQAVN
jgi:hypothetical protein